jgi:4-amino-4-deoxy-L-arabinose transferase-like glycosyltransferase
MNRASSLVSLLIILSAAFALFIYETGSYPLIGVDEPRYVETAREMLERGDLVTPYCHYQPRYDKPVFFYWLEALSIKAFGLNELAARLPSVIAGTGMVALAYLLGNIQGYGLIAAGIIATTLEIVVASKLSITDITLCYFISATIAFFFLGYVNQDSYRRKFAFHRKTTSNWFISMFIMAAFGALTKGPVALVLPLAVILPFLVYEKNLVRCLVDSSREMLTGLIGFCLIILPWYISVHIATHGEFTNKFFITHNFDRFTSTVSNHHGPIWFYIPVLIIGFFPWISVIVPAIKATLKQGSSTQLSSRFSSSLLAKFCLWWALVVFVFFSISATKLPTYILPIYLPLSIIVAAWWSDAFSFERTQPWRNLAGLIGIGLTLITLITGLVLVTGVFKTALSSISPDSFTLAFLIIGFLLIAGFSIAMTAILRQAEIAFITIAITTAIAYFIATPMLLKVYAQYMDDGLRTFARKSQGALYTLETQRTNLFFYAQREVPALKYPELMAKLSNGEALTLVVKNSQLDKLQAKLLTQNGTTMLTEVKAGKRYHVYMTKE